MSRPRSFVVRVARGALWLVIALAILVAVGFRRDRPVTEVEARRATAPSKFVVVDGLRTHYRDRGTGPVVVLVHGSNSSLLTWEGWATVLATEHRVISMDLPGHGITGPEPQGRYSAADMADFLDRFLTTIGVTKGITLAGNSMGGNIAWRYTAAHPEKIERLILVDSAGYPREEPRPFGFRMFGTPGLGTIARWVTPRFLIARSVRDTYGDPTRVTDERIDIYEDMLLREGNREATRARFRSTVDEDPRAKLATIKVPTLILWGERDKWILPKYGQRFEKDIPGAKLVMLEGLGHVPMEEDPALSLAPVLELLRRK